uniref:Programmed cell death 5 n=1 Tax=Oryzias latipes TaxID=8090 RepID=A0A3P9H7F2_ORYLA
MADDELEAIRRQRMAELQAKHGDASNNQQEETKQRETEMRNSILAQVLDQSARARCKSMLCFHSKFWEHCLFNYNIFFDDLYFISEQPGIGEARQGKRSGELSYTNGSIWKVRRKGTKQKKTKNS